MARSGERLERGGIRGQRERSLVAGRLPAAAQRHPCVRIVPRDGDDRSASRQARPTARWRSRADRRATRSTRARATSTTGQYAEARRASHPATGCRRSAILARRRSPVQSCQLSSSLWRIRVRGDSEPAEPADVLDHVTRFTGEPIGGAWHPQRDVVAARRADLDAVQDQHAVDVTRRVREPASRRRDR